MNLSDINETSHLLNLSAKRPNHPDVITDTKLVPEVYGLIAVGANGAFGLLNGLPWKNKTDMAWFKHITNNRVVAVSKKTLETIPNGLPGRSIQVLERAKDVVFHPTKDMFFIGGKKVLMANLHNLDGFYITIIPGEHIHDVSFNIDELLAKGFVVDIMGTSKSKTDSCHLLVLSRGDAKKPLVRLDHNVAEYFEPYLKLTTKKHVSIAPGAHGTVEVNEKVYTPRNQIGLFDVRKRLADNGLYTTGISFKRQWIGTPTITVTNKSQQFINLYPNEEIGEISFVNSPSI